MKSNKYKVMALVALYAFSGLQGGGGSFLGGLGVGTVAGVIGTKIFSRDSRSYKHDLERENEALYQENMRLKRQLEE